VSSNTYIWFNAGMYSSMDIKLYFLIETLVAALNGADILLLASFVLLILNPMRKYEFTLIFIYTITVGWQISVGNDGRGAYHRFTLINE